MIHSTVFRFALVTAITTCGLSAFGDPPLMLWQDITSQSGEKAIRTVKSCAILRRLDGSFAFYDRRRPESGPLALPDKDNVMHTLLPYLPGEIVRNDDIVESGILNNTQVLQTGEFELFSAFVRGEKLDRDAVARVGLPRYLNVWTQQASATNVAKPKMIWRGYNGSQIEYERMPNGRLLVPFGSFQPHATPTPPNGRHKTVVQFSDDHGATWTESSSQLVSPCYEGFNGLNEGACEPAFERLRDGRLWMLMRSQAGFLYESWSHDNGTTWQAAAASRFNTSTGPPCIMRHQDGRLVLCWNNCEMPPRANGDGVYGGRDVLHIAISDDDGMHWSGFREIYLDHRRNDNPAKSGDRGTAYPLMAYTSDGKILVIAGQGRGGRNVILVDADWITESTAQSNFENELQDWSVYTHFGPAKGWWRAREVGSELIPSPTDASDKCLRIRHQSHLPADGATWNFPNGWEAKLNVRVMQPAGSQGGSIALTDRMFDPSNDYGEQFAVFRLGLDSTGTVGSQLLKPDGWHDISFHWNLSQDKCQVSVDGRVATTLPLLNSTLNGINYVRFRGSLQSPDPVGFLVSYVDVKVQDRTSPTRTAKDQREHEQRYVDNVVPTWQN